MEQLTPVVAFCGAHGTGKTTLVKAAQYRLERASVAATVLPELPRVLCDAAGDPEFFRRGHNSLERQLTLLVGQPIIEAVARRAGHLVLCDRTLLDHWAYSRVLHGPALASTGLSEVLHALVKSYCSTYDHIFYVPIEFPPTDDGTREGDAAFQLDVDTEIRSLLDTFQISTTELRGSVDDRAAVFFATLKERFGLSA